MPINRKGSGVAPGNIDYVAASTPPAGWIKANGAAVSRSTYAALFAAIGTVYGVGDGSTTFNVPDLRGEFVRGWDDARGVDSGRAIGTAQANQMGSHTHAQNGVADVTNGSAGLQGSASANTGAMGTTAAAGGTSNSSENRPRNVAMLACIKY